MRLSASITSSLALNQIELAEHVAKIVGNKTPLRFMPLPHDNPKQRQPDISLAKKVLDWQPRVSLEDGLKETVGYFRKVIEQ